MSEIPGRPVLRPGPAAEIERALEHPSIKVSAVQSQAPRRTVLAREYLRALRSTGFASVTSLLAAGVSWQAITDAVPAHTRVSVSADNIFQFDEDGGDAFVVPVKVETPLTPEASDPVEAIRRSWIIDLLAFHPAHPSKWALRTGAAEWLGCVEPQYLDPEPVPVWRTPLRWLQAGCHGLVLLSRERDSQYGVLSGLCAIVAEDHYHAAELRSILNVSWSTPPVTVPEVRRAA